MSELQAVLFDMDGTICDTEPTWMAAEHAMAERYGASWTPEDGLRLLGHDLLWSGAYIKEHMGLAHSPAEVAEELVDGVVAGVATEGVEWRPGALELLHACNDAGIPTALVTMSYARFAHAIVAGMPIGRFDAMVTGDQVERGKPAPDAYLAGAGLLQAEPAASVAIEDSPAGAASAEAAGCLVVVVPNLVVVPETPARRHFSTLEGVEVEDLRQLVAQR